MSNINTLVETLQLGKASASPLSRQRGGSPDAGVGFPPPPPLPCIPSAEQEKSLLPPPWATTYWFMLATKPMTERIPLLWQW